MSGFVEFVIPFWGDPALLGLTLESLLALDDTDWTAVVVDDAAPAGVEAAARVQQLDDWRIRYVRNPVNLGITANFQRCLELAEATYVVLPGCDDLVLPGYVTALREVTATHGPIEVFQPGVTVIDGDGRPVTPLGDRIKAWARRPWPVGQPLGGDRTVASLLNANWLYFPSLALRRDAALAAGGFDGQWLVVEDLALVLGILRRGGRLVLDDRPALAYRRHAASVSSTEAVSGRRFAEERSFFRIEAAEARRLDWPQSERAARRHLTSRLHAATLLPKSRQWTVTRDLLTHVLA